MSPASKINQPSQSGTDLRGGPESPTQPGIYWFHSETTSRALMVDVPVTKGQLTVWWPNQDVPVTNQNGFWRGPIPPSSGPGSHSIHLATDSVPEERVKAIRKVLGGGQSVSLAVAETVALTRKPSTGRLPHQLLPDRA